jgi:uncharacterized protein YdeI (YjbR/CyaY-like superfamily)
MEESSSGASCSPDRTARSKRAATHWVMSAKREETRRRRLRQLIEDSAGGLDVKPLRRPDRAQ